MKTLIASDLQFSEQVRYSRPTETGLTSRLEDQVRCFDWILSVGVLYKCKRFITLGDTFDSRTALPLSVIDQVGRCFARAADLFDENIALVGNHESALRSPAINSLQALRGLATVIERPTVIGECAFVPWMEDGDTFRAGVHEVSRSRSAAYLFSHTLVEGAVPASVGRALTDLRPKRWKGVFLGDVHDPIKVATNVQYAGAPMQHHFGDAGGKRGVWILDTKSGKSRFVENRVSPRFYVVRTRAELQDVRPIDFVRVETDNPLMNLELVALASKKAARVDSDLVVLEDDSAPRIPISASDSDRKIIKRWVTFKEIEDVAGYTTLGESLLEEARR